MIISRRYQLHSISATMQHPKDIMDAHTLKTKRRRRKLRYSDLSLVAVVHLPPRQHLESKFFKDNASKKDTLRKLHRCPVIDLRFSP
jgi:hypothetical protein